MKQSKFLIPLVLLFALVSQTSAQHKKLSAQATIGVTTPILDNGVGFHLGVNPYLRITERFSLEAQVSYLYTKIGSSFLSGDIGSNYSINTLAGARFYLSAEEKSSRVFLNFLVGLNYLMENQNNVAKDGEFGLGYAGGIFMDFSKLLVGISYDTPQNLVLKLGYSF